MVVSGSNCGSWLAERLLAFQEALSFLESVGVVLMWFGIGVLLLRNPRTVREPVPVTEFGHSPSMKQRHSCVTEMFQHVVAAVHINLSIDLVSCLLHGCLPLPVIHARPCRRAPGVT
jgi:hypothetical protein